MFWTCYYNEICFGLRRRNNELHELTNFGGGGWEASITTKYIWLRYYNEICFGLGRRNNELHELTNFVGGGWGARETTKYIWVRYYNEIYLASDGVTTNYTN